MPPALRVYSADGVPLLTNPAFRALFGSDTLEREAVLPPIQRALSGEVVRLPLASRVGIEGTWIPLHDDQGVVTHVAAVFRDVTAERVASEGAEAVLAQLAEGVIITDVAGRIIFVNEAARQLHGTRELGVGVQDYTAAYHLFTVEGEPYPAEELPLARAVLQGETVIDARWRIRRPDGSEILAEGSAAPVLAADGTRLGSALVLRDISAQTRLELEKEEFLESAAHDLKTPLTAVLGSAQVLRRRLRERRSDPERQALTLENIEASARRMDALLDQLLDLGRLRMDRPLDLDPHPIDLVGLAREAVAAHQEATELHRLELETDEPALVGVWDATRLRRVLDNLLDNAMKYSPSGGVVRVRINRRVDAEGGACATLSVSDEGLGIPAADQPRVFDRFRRGGNVAGRIRGTGIGLAAARQVIEQHGGSIEVSSREGHGSTFTVRLPL